jgi:hypothetical protein
MATAGIKIPYENLGDKIKGLGSAYAILGNELWGNTPLSDTQSKEAAYCWERVSEVKKALSNYNSLSEVPTGIDLNKLIKQIDEEISYILIRVVLSQEARGANSSEIEGTLTKAVNLVPDNQDLTFKSLLYKGVSVNVPLDLTKYTRNLPEKTDLGFLLS